MINIEIKLSNSNSLTFNCTLNDLITDDRRSFLIINPPAYITNRILIKSISYKCNLNFSENCYLKLNLSFGNFNFSTCKLIDIEFFKTDLQIKNEIQNILEMILIKENSLLFNLANRDENRDYDFADIESLV